MNTTNKILFAAFLTAATSTTFANPHSHLAVAADVSPQEVRVEAEYTANQALLEQFNIRQQDLIERLEVDNQIEFDERVDLGDLDKLSETHSINQ